MTITTPRDGTPTFFPTPIEALASGLAGFRREKCQNFTEWELPPEVVQKCQFSKTPFIDPQPFYRAIAYQDGFCIDWVILTLNGWRFASFPEVVWIEARAKV